MATGTRLAYTLAEAAQMLGCSEWTVRRAIERGQLPRVNTAMSGRRVLIPAVALEQAVADLATFETAAS